MALSEKSLNFTLRVYNGKFINKEKANILHPLLVGFILQYYGYDDEVVAAGYLHEIPYISDYTIDDIAALFGGKVASLVFTSQPANDDLEFNDKKIQTIKAISHLPENNLALICADKIVELGSIKIYFDYLNGADYSLLDVDFDELKDYYLRIYHELDNISPMLKRHLRESIDSVFDYKEEKPVYNDYMDIFGTEESEDTERLRKLKKVLMDHKPYIIRFAASKNHTDNLEGIIDELIEGDSFRIKVSDTSNYQKVGISLVERNLLLSSYFQDGLLEQIVGDKDILIIDSYLYDLLTSLTILTNDGSLNRELLSYYLKEYGRILSSLFNYVELNYVNDKELEYDREDELTDNIDSLLNTTNIVDITKISEKEATLLVADTLLPIMQDKYVLSLKKYIDKNNEAA